MLTMTPSPPRQHRRDHRMGAEKRPAQMHGDHAVPVRDAEGLEPSLLHDAGVVDEERAISKGCAAGIHHACHRMLIADIDGDGDRPFTQRRSRGLGAVEVAVGDHHAGARRHQFRGGSAADAGGGSGDDGDVVGEGACH